MSTTRKMHQIRYFGDKMAFTVGPVELDHMISEKDNTVVVDVRSESDYVRGHIPGAVNLPMERWDTFEGLDLGKTNVIYCYTQQCHLAAKACLKFASKGYPVMELEGGWAAWKEYGMRVETTELRKVA